MTKKNHTEVAIIGGVLSVVQSLIMLQNQASIVC